MSFYYSDDPIKDFEEKDQEDSAWLERRPVCCGCGDHIQDDYAYKDGSDWYCDNCKDELADKLLSGCYAQIPEEGN